ncbi:glycosyl transferase, partial [Bacillus cereus]|nr:glycosyl transferase [Bacillus cereus]
LVPPDQPTALADALEKMMGDPVYRYQLSRAGWEKAKKSYSLTRGVNELKNIYLQVNRKS